MVKRVFTVVHRDPRSSAGKIRKWGWRMPAQLPTTTGKPLIHCACAPSLSPQFEFCRMSQSLVLGNRLAALRGCAFLLHLSVTPNQDPISFERLSSRAHFSSFLVNVSAPACPVHRICCACASILTSPQPWSYYAVPVRQFCSPPSASISVECLSSRAHF